MPFYRELPIWKFRKGKIDRTIDKVTPEEPLAIRLIYGREGARKSFTLAVTMRTPGHDEDLAVGFLYTEGIIDSTDRISGVRTTPGIPDQEVIVEIAADFHFNPEKWQRNFYTSSSCGVCGKGAIEQVHTTVPYLLKKWEPRIDASFLERVQARLYEEQETFRMTGGIHAAALYDCHSGFVSLREDVGRHNAMDKLIGSAAYASGLPLSEYCVLVSGRASFELVQKALMAGIPVLLAFGAPSSLAVDLAAEHHMTVIGFLKDRSFNVYCGAERLGWSD